MTLKYFKSIMISSLSSIYEKDELNSIFNLIAEDYLKISRSKILLADEINLNEETQALFLKALERLKTHEPIQYVLGKTSFMDLEFKVNSSVLIPRPETEELVRLILKEDLDGKEILDIGTGSGCIAISLAKNLPNTYVTAVDICKDAMEVAKENSKLNNVNIELINADIFEFKSEKKFDLIVSNPPYVLKSDKTLMRENVLNYEPEIALIVDDNNPLKYYEKIIDFSKNHLNENGQIFFEINDKKSKDFKNILKLYNKHKSVFLMDSFKKTRFLKIQLF
jgi:release factor glutamine methyltransferase